MLRLSRAAEKSNTCPLNRVGYAKTWMRNLCALKSVAVVFVHVYPTCNSEKIRKFDDSDFAAISTVYGRGISHAPSNYEDCIKITFFSFSCFSLRAPYKSIVKHGSQRSTPRTLPYNIFNRLVLTLQKFTKKTNGYATKDLTKRV